MIRDTFLKRESFFHALFWQFFDSVQCFFHQQTSEHLCTVLFMRFPGLNGILRVLKY